MIKHYFKQALVAAAITLLCVQNAEATPAFARQMDSACSACHAQNMPKLNSFGRDFKMSGYTMVGAIKEIEATDRGGLNLPAVLNFGFIIKARYHDVDKGSGGAHTSATEIFDESAIVLGGKIADNIGTSMEFTSGLVGGKIAMTDEFSFGRLGAAIFMTDALGAFTGTEIYNTGLYRPIRQFENRKRANIFQNTGVGDGAAQGGQLYYYGNGLYITIGGYTPVFGNSVETNGHYKTLARAAYEFNLESWSVMLGGYYIGGDIRSLDGTATGKETAWDYSAFSRKSAGADIQLYGEFDNGMSLMVTGGAVLKNEYNKATIPTTGPVTYAPTKSDQTGFSIGMQLNPTERYAVKLGYLSYKDDVANANNQNIYNVGAEYNYRQNVRMVLEYALTTYPDANTKDQGDILLMAMLAF